MKIRAALLIVSDRISAGLKADRSGEEASAALQTFAEVVEKSVVADEYAEIRRRLLEWCDGGIDLIFTIGGTGFSPRDVTPEATRSVIEREASGVSLGLLFHGLSHTPRAMLSRAVAGIRGRSLIINLPGSPSAVRESIEYLEGILPHALEMMAGRPHDDN